MVVFMGFQMLIPTMPQFVQQLGGSESIVGLIIGIFTLSAMLVRPWTGLQLDRKGRKGLLISGLLVSTAVSFTYGWAGSIVMLLLLRLVHGVGWGACTTATGTVATDLVPASRRGEGMGFFGMSGNLSMALGPGLGMWVLQQSGFNVLFTASAALGLVAILLSLFIRYQKVSPPQVSVKPALFERQALPSSVTMFFLTLTLGGVISFAPLLIIQRQLGSPGWFFLVYALVLMLSRPVAGMLADRKGPGIIVIPGLVIVAIATAMIGYAYRFDVLMLSAVLYGAGFGSAQPILQGLTVARVAPDRRGAANGTFFAAFDLGVGIGAIGVGFISEVAGFGVAYSIVAVTLLLGLALYIRAARRHGFSLAG